MKSLMMIILVIVVVVGAFAVARFLGALGGGVQVAEKTPDGSLWELSTATLEGEPVSLGDWRGDVVLVVNVASKCGLTPQYTGLDELHREFDERGFAVLGFPCNQFLGQEPGTAAEIRTFCTNEYSVSFPMFEKLDVKGDGRSPVYDFLLAGGLEEPTWNFTKYLVGRDGKVVARFAPKTEPRNAELRSAILKALGD